jgi:poly-gamma-glutamate synthesis protein (capsule biosynthesis protein)
MIRLKAVGDISLKTKFNRHPFTKIKDALSDKDILFGNLETVLSKRGRAAEKAHPLYIDPGKVKYLKDAGFDILNVANNHVMDLGFEGFDETLDVLHKNNISFIGGSNPKFTESHVVMKIKGMRLGFLAYFEDGYENDQNGHCINRISEQSIVRDITVLKSSSDIVIISMHWGKVESVFYPSREQIELARKLIDAGAAAVLGHGPHVNQGMERYRNGLIAYSLGNFQFDYDHEEHDRIATVKVSESLILSLNITMDGVESYDVVPVKIDKQYLPSVMVREEAENHLNFISGITRAVTEGRVTERWWFEQIAGTCLKTNMFSWRTRIRKFGLRHAYWCLRWLVSPFVVKCYIGLLSRTFKKIVRLQNYP